MLEYIVYRCDTHTHTHTHTHLTIMIPHFAFALLPLHLTKKDDLIIVIRNRICSSLEILIHPFPKIPFAIVGLLWPSAALYPI